MHEKPQLVLRDPKLGLHRLEHLRSDVAEHGEMRRCEVPETPDRISLDNDCEVLDLSAHLAPGGDAFLRG
jgi:hypothetical protein